MSSEFEIIFIVARVKSIMMKAKIERYANSILCMTEMQDMQINNGAFLFEVLPKQVKVPINQQEGGLGCEQLPRHERDDDFNFIMVLLPRERENCKLSVRIVCRIHRERSSMTYINTGMKSKWVDCDIDSKKRSVLGY
jgi:hypothetical protein